jgi:beta-glucuronidase
MLAPRDSRSRESRRLDGLWRFRIDPGGEGSAGRWWERRWDGAREIAVPASFNDLTTDPAEREHVGDVWYQRDIQVPASWAGRRIVVRCDAVTHRGTVWAGDVQVADHCGGYTPFEADVTQYVRCGEPFRLTVRVNNELTMATIPPGVISVGSTAASSSGTSTTSSTIRGSIDRCGCARRRGRISRTCPSRPASISRPGSAG